MQNDRPSKGKLTVRFRRRDDGGLRAYCSEVPGFFLSSIERRAVMNDVIPALEMLLKANFDLAVQVSPLGYGIYELIERELASSGPEIPDVPEYFREYVVEPLAA
jgi:hypothetical protein